MSKIEGSPSCLEVAKHLTFGESLRQSIKAQFGSNVEFARQLGVSRGRISQIISGPEIVGPETLEKILFAFRDTRYCTVIERAWLREFVHGQESPEAELSHAGVIHRIHQLNAEGLTPKAIELAQKRRDSLVIDSGNEWLDLTTQIIQCALRVGNTAKAAANVTMLAEAAVATGRLDMYFLSRWHKAIVLQALGGQSSDEVFELLGEVHSLALSQGRSAEWTRATATAERDIAIYTIKQLAKSEVSGGVEGSSSRVLDLIESSIEKGGDEMFYRYGIEAKARLFAAIGQPANAEDSVLELRKEGIPEGSDLWEKSELTIAKIHEMDGNLSRALEAYRVVSKVAEQRSNLHHQRLANLSATSLILKS